MFLRILLGPNSACVNPRTERSDLRGGQSVTLGWHELIRVSARHPRDEFAFAALAGDDGRFARLASAQCVGLPVEAQFAFLLIRSVTFIAAFDEDGFDVVREVHWQSGEVGKIDDYNSEPQP